SDIDRIATIEMQQRTDMSIDDANIQMHAEESSELGMEELGALLGSAPRQVANCLLGNPPQQVASFLRPAGESSLTGSKLPTCLLGYFLAGSYLPAKDSLASSYLPAEDSLAGSYLPPKESPSRQAATCKGLLTRQVATCRKESLAGR
ncbi:hypothetical protein PCASD_19933, partial [Puccinia coronata f. sp. avenae]